MGGENDSSKEERLSCDRRSWDWLPDCWPWVGSPGPPPRPARTTATGITTIVGITAGIITITTGRGTGARTTLPITGAPIITPRIAATTIPHTPLITTAATALATRGRGSASTSRPEGDSPPRCPGESPGVSAALGY